MTLLRDSVRKNTEPPRASTATCRMIVRAITTLKGSKKGIKGDPSKLDFLQVKAVAMTLIGEHAAKAIAALSQLQAPRAYGYQSDDIIAVLGNWKGRFLENKEELDEDEFELNS